MLKLLIQQHRAPRTRFTVRYGVHRRAFNTFAEVKAYLMAIHSVEQILP